MGARRPLPALCVPLKEIPGRVKVGGFSGPVLGGEPVLEIRDESGDQPLESEDPDEPDDDVAGQEEEEEDPVGVEEPLAQAEGPDAADDGEDPPLEEEGRVGVDGGRLVGAHDGGREELPPRVGEEGEGRRGEDEDAGHQEQVGGVDPEPVVAHGLQG